MMPATHMLVGGIMAAVIHSASPVGISALLAAGILGGFFPDIDILHGHRRWLHYPVLYGVVSALLTIAILLTGLTFLLIPLVFFLSAWIHSVMDIFAGAELRSWEESEWREEAVYNHVTGSWIRPRRWVYGGSPGDSILSLAAGLILIYTLPASLHPIVAGLVALGVLQTLTIRPLSNRVPRDHPTWAHFVQTAVFGKPPSDDGK